MQLLQIHRNWDRFSLHLLFLSDVFIFSRNTTILAGSDSQEGRCIITLGWKCFHAFCRCQLAWSRHSNSVSTACIAIVDKWLWLHYSGCLAKSQLTACSGYWWEALRLQRQTDVSLNPRSDHLPAGWQPPAIFSVSLRVNLPLCWKGITVPNLPRGEKN